MYSTINTYEDLELNQILYNGSGTLEIIVQCKNLYQSITKRRNCYQLLYQEEGGDVKFYIDSDLVENPKSLSVYDWQLLKILHPRVKSYQWEIFHTLKDLVDNRAEEEYVLETIKNVLQQGNKIEP
jgi:hypothetical protein